MMISYYVVQTDYNNRVKMWNVFDNTPLRDATKKLIKEYKTKKMSFEAFTKELQSLIMWQEWSRCEYEIVVAGFPSSRDTEGDKIDAYYQCVPNMKLIAKCLLEDAYPRLKIKPEEMNFEIKYYCCEYGRS